MKKLLFLLLLAPLLFISCGDDDDDGGGEKSPNVEGTWKYTSVTGDTIRTVEFLSNGDMKYSGEDTDGQVKTYKYSMSKYSGFLTIDGFTYIVKAFIRDIDGQTILRTANSSQTPPADYPHIYTIYDKYGSGEAGDHSGLNSKIVKEFPFVRID